MQFSTLIAAATTFALAMGSPVALPGGGSGDNNSQKCTNNFEARCCSDVSSFGVGSGLLAGLGLGIGCIQVPVLGCGALNFQDACCTSNTAQFGLVNVNLACIL